MLSVFSAIGSLLGGPLTAITGQIAGIFTNAQTTTATEYASLTTAQQLEYAALMRAQSDLNQSKVANNATWIGHLMVFLFGAPAAVYLGSINISAAFPQLGWAVYGLKGDIGQTVLSIDKTIALSFFLYVPVVSFTSWLKAK